MNVKTAKRFVVIQKQQRRIIPIVQNIRENEKEN